jgi:hypothetical protein
MVEIYLKEEGTTDEGCNEQRGEQRRNPPVRQGLEHSDNSPESAVDTATASTESGRLVEA